MDVPNSKPQIKKNPDRKLNSSFGVDISNFGGWDLLEIRFSLV
jgi:hypothetical protein